MLSRKTAKLPLEELVSSGKVYFTNNLIGNFSILFSHRFPSAKSRLYTYWIQIIQQQLKIHLFIPKENTVVCSNHFEEHCFNRSKRLLHLRAGSKPTLFNNSDDAVEQVFKL